MLVILDEGWDTEVLERQDVDEDDSYRITAHDIYLEKLWREKHCKDEEDE